SHRTTHAHRQDLPPFPTRRSSDLSLITINANTDGAGAQGFTMNAGGAITTTNATAGAVAINVNAAAGGTGAAALRSITTGSGGKIGRAHVCSPVTSGGRMTPAAGK